MKTNKTKTNPPIQLLSILSRKNYDQEYEDILYDLENKEIICKHTHQEKLDLFHVAISFLEQLDSHTEQILILKQGFPSVFFLQKYLMANKHFIFSLPKSFIKEVNGFRSSNQMDAQISISYSKRRAHDAKITDPLILPYTFEIRGIKTDVQKEDTPILLTDLLETDFSGKEIISFYQTPEVPSMYNF